MRMKSRVEQRVTKSARTLITPWITRRVAILLGQSGRGINCQKAKDSKLRACLITIHLSAHHESEKCRYPKTSSSFI